MILFLPLQIFDIGPDHLLICVIEKKKSKMFQYFFWNCSWPQRKIFIFCNNFDYRYLILGTDYQAL